MCSSISYTPPILGRGLHKMWFLQDCCISGRGRVYSSFSTQDVGSSFLVSPLFIEGSSKAVDSRAVE